MLSRVCADMTSLTRRTRCLFPRMGSVARRANLPRRSLFRIDGNLCSEARTARAGERENRRVQLEIERRIERWHDGGVLDVRRRCDLEAPVRRARRRMTPRAVRQHRALFSVNAVAGRAGKLCPRMMIESRRAGRPLALRMAPIARRCRLRTECVTREAGRGRLRSPVVVLRRLALVTLRTDTGRWCLVGALVALGAGDLLLADVAHVHRRFPRGFPRRRDQLDGRGRRSTPHEREDRKRGSTHECEEQNSESASTGHDP